MFSIKNKILCFDEYGILCVYGSKKRKYGYTTGKTYCVECNKYRNFVPPKMYIFSKTLVLFIISSKCTNNNDRIFKEGESIGMLKIFGLIDSIE